jgi:hypothetical protein
MVYERASSASCVVPSEVMPRLAYLAQPQCKPSTTLSIGSVIPPARLPALDLRRRP